MADQKKKITRLKTQYASEKNREQERIKAVEEKRRRGLSRRLTALAAVGILFTIIASVTLISQWSMLEAKKEERNSLEIEIKELQAEEIELKQEIENYNDIDYIAEIARRDYYLTKPGETLFKVPAQQQSD
ncbi:FtsB family cell division protein [Bacillus sp. FJAT-44742]|uniref:FtsB family cell division protein n=1 Tax=Bacillus sp. FJAT-44742 TaxID=2014005 RepID=UPI000C23410B|nr:septum formation initiator family protein [Bacillus sp. FJAT-44742]